MTSKTTEVSNGTQNAGMLVLLLTGTIYRKTPKHYLNVSCTTNCTQYSANAPHRQVFLLMAAQLASLPLMRRVLRRNPIKVACTARPVAHLIYQITSTSISLFFVLRYVRLYRHVKGDKWRSQPTFLDYSHDRCKSRTYYLSMEIHMLQTMRSFIELRSSFHRWKCMFSAVMGLYWGLNYGNNR